MSEISTGGKQLRRRNLSLQAKHFFACSINGPVFAAIGRQLRSVAFCLLINLASVSGADAQATNDCGTIIFPPLSDITSFNPLFAESLADSEAAQLLFLNLIWVNRFGQVDWSRSLASEIQTSQSGQIYTVTIRPWHWSDGVPVTTADVLYNFKLIKALDATASGFGTGGMPGIIKRMVALDATHFQVILTRPVNPTWFILDGLSQLQPVPWHVWSHYTIDQLFQAQSTPSFFKVVDGPLNVKELNFGSDAIFDLNPYYDGPKMHFERFIFKFIETDGAMVQQIEAGDVDLVQLPTELWNNVKTLPGTHVVSLAPALGSDIIELNFQNPQVAFFKDVRVRQAMEDALDQSSLIKTVFHGFGTEVHTTIPPGAGAFLAPQLKNGEYPVGYNPRKALSLLKQAGYAPGPDGVMQKDGHRLEFTDLLATGSEEFILETEFIQADLRDVGIQMDLRPMDFNHVEALMNGPVSGWQAAIYETFYSNYPSGDSSFASGSPGNQGGFSDPEMDHRIADSTYKSGLNGLYDYEIYASAMQPSITVVSEPSLYLVADRLHGANDFIDPAGQLAPDKLTCSENPYPR